jgi:hypothetical protein
MTEPDSAALGTVLRSSTVDHLAATAGFNHAERSTSTLASSRSTSSARDAAP